MPSFRALVLMPVVLLALMGFQSHPETKPQTPSTQPSGDGPVLIAIRTARGDIYAELDKDKAPITVQNFVSYVNDEHYDGTIFHRVIKDFMIQGGGMSPDMRQKPTKPPIRLESDNGLKNTRGTLAMARTSAPDSATSQFFINLKDNSFLDRQAGGNPGYAVFGKVIAGMDVVDEIALVTTGVRGGHRDVPVETITIEEIRIVDEDEAEKAKKAEAERTKPE